MRSSVSYLALLCLSLPRWPLLSLVRPVQAFSQESPAGKRHSSNGPTSASSSSSPTIRTGAEYAAYWDELLLTEYREKVENLKEQRRTWSRQQLERRGVCVFGATAVPDSEVLGEKIVRISQPASAATSWSWRNLFSRGEILLLTPETGSGGAGWNKHAASQSIPIPKECLVIDVGKNWMTVGVGASWPPGLWESRKFQYLVRLDRTAPRAPLKAQRTALDRVRRDQGGTIAKVLSQTFDPTIDAEVLASQVPHRTNSTRIAQDIHNALSSALQKTKFQPNVSQRQAIEWALERKISLIRGPPGTGKTRLASLLVATALGVKDSGQVSGEIGRPNRVLAVTHSNGAADILLEGLLQMGVPAVRLGRPASVDTNVQHRTVVALAEKMPAVVELRHHSRNMDLTSQERSRAAFALRQTMVDTQRMITQTAPVVVTSCISAHQLFLGASAELDEESAQRSPVEFPLVVLDEAAQTTEPALVCALAAAKAEQLIMVGDTRQLPPTITCMSLLDSLGRSPMQRLEDCGVGEVTLQMQYRMPPALLKHPSAYFYNDQVKCAPEKLQESISRPAGFAWPSMEPLAFVHVGTGECEVAHDIGSRSNPTECRLVVRIVSDFLKAGDIEASQIAVISPYAKQVQLIRSEFSALPILEGVQIGTVDAFQGQETDIVIFSAVRSNDLKEVGFLRDARRLNVAITRSRRGLVLVGDRSTLSACHHWESLILSMEERGCVMTSEHLSGSPSAAPESIDASVDVLFDEADILKRLFGENDLAGPLLEYPSVPSASPIESSAPGPAPPLSSSALSATFEFEYDAPNPGERLYTTDLPSAFESGMPAGLRGEAVRSALRSGRGVMWSWDEAPAFSRNGLLLVKGKGCIDFLNNKLSNSFRAEPGGVSFQRAGVLTARGRLIDVVGVSVADNQCAWVQTSPGHSARALYDRWDPFVFPLDEVTLHVVEESVFSFSVASVQLADVQRAFQEYVRPRMGLKAELQLPNTFKECLYVPNDDGSLHFLAVPCVHLPSTAAVGYTFWCDDSSAWDLLSSNPDGWAPVVIGPLEYESLRIQAGSPSFNAEITGNAEKEKAASTPATPMELHMNDLVDYEKGCYMGQEGIASILKNPRGPPRSLYHVVFDDEFNLYDSETAGEASSSVAVDNLTRLPRPGDDLFVLGSNEEILVGTLTSVAEPGSTGDRETLGLALVRRADSILQSMRKRDIEIPRIYNIAEVDSSSGMIQPPPMDRLDGLEVILKGSFTIGTLRSIPSRRLPPGKNMFVNEVRHFLDELPFPKDGAIDVTRAPLAGGPATGHSNTSEEQSSKSTGVTEKEVPVPEEAVQLDWEKSVQESASFDDEEADQAALEEAAREAATAKAAAEAAAAEAERKAAKMEMLRKRAEEAMARRQAKKNKEEE